MTSRGERWLAGGGAARRKLAESASPPEYFADLRELCLIHSHGAPQRADQNVENVAAIDCVNADSSKTEYAQPEALAEKDFVHRESLKAQVKAEPTQIQGEEGKNCDNPQHGSETQQHECGCGSCRDCTRVEVVKGTVREDMVDVILKDVPRSFGDDFAHYESEGRQADLTDLLITLCFYKPEVGYTQGMNFIALMALAHMSIDDAFWFLVDLTESLPEGFLQRAVLDEVELFEEVVGRYAPVITEHLGTDPEELHRCMSYLLVQWMLPIFAHALPLETTLEIWDFLFDSKAQNPRKDSLVLNLHRITFALVEVHSGPLLSKHRAALEAFNALSLHDNSPYASEVRTSLDQTTGMEFVQALLQSASEDNNPRRLVRLAREVTVEQEWLASTRQQLDLERSSTCETALSANDVNPEFGIRHNASTEVKVSSNCLLGCQNKSSTLPFSEPAPPLKRHESSPFLSCMGIRNISHHSFKHDKSKPEHYQSTGAQYSEIKQHKSSKDSCNLQ